jgi:hypothetical protein
VPGAVPGRLHCPLKQGRQADWPVGVGCERGDRKPAEGRASALCMSAPESGWLFSSRDSRQSSPMWRLAGRRCSRQLENTCASHVRMRTTPPRHFFSSATIELDLPSAAHRAPARSSETLSRLPRRHTHMSPCAARAAGDRRTTSPERLKACLLHKTCLSAKSLDVFHAVTGRASGAKRSGPPRSLGYGRRFTDRPAGRED